MKYIIPLLILCLLITACNQQQGSHNAQSNESLEQQLNLPPDPGEAGKATLAGIDSDNDGLRDDVQRYIALNYYDRPNIRNALTQYAIARQGFILATDEASVDEFANQAGYAQDCLRTILLRKAVDDSFVARIEAGRDVVPMLDGVEDVILNTELRRESYTQADFSRAGKSVPDNLPIDRQLEYCNFEVTTDE